MTQKPDININDEREIRLHKLGELEQAGINAYPAKTIREHTLEQALKKAVGESVSVAGRIMVKREMGKLTFCHLQDASEKMQVVFKQNDIGDDQYTLFTKHIDAGDFIAVQGERFQTQKGEESILVKKWQIVSKALLPLPDKFHGLKDKETRFRKRYLDLIMNRDVFELFKKRSRIISLVREYLNKADFLEVETPALQVLYGGTNAKPFETHINAYDMKMYMRVAPELYLKRLVVGGYERVYEIGKNFRNEGVDQTHNPEFTMIEWYESFIDYNGVMDRAEGLYKFIAKELFGDDMKVPVGDNIVDFKKTWPRVRMVDAIKKYTSYDVENLDEKELKNICTAEKVEIRGSATRGQMIMEIFEKLVTDKLTNPTWIIDYPKEVSPLSKVHRDNPDFVERFECYVMGKEIGDGWSEIINPQTQRDRFENEQQAMKEGDDESHPMDEDFIEALEHGMPPLGGIGVGIDRLVMLFTNKWSIREIIFFPIMKPENYSSTQASGSAAKTDPDAKQIGTSSKNINQTLPISREEALAFIKEHTEKEANLNHYLESEAVMRGIAQHLGEDEEYWGMLGLLHDIDWEITEHDSTTHLTKAPAMLKEKGFDEDFIQIILSHGYGYDCANLQDKKRSEKLEHALACSETVTGLIYATALMRPNKIMDLEVKSVKKKMKDKKFAANVDRDVIRECEQLGISLDEFLGIAIGSMKKIADDIGLS